MKAKPVSVSIAFDGRHGGHPEMYVTLVDSDGNVHERSSTMPPGAWITWPSELLPERK